MTTETILAHRLPRGAHVVRTRPNIPARPRHARRVRLPVATPVETFDAYCYAVAYLTERPEEIHFAWGSPLVRLGGILFGFATSSRGTIELSDAGCLTIIRADLGVAQTEELTLAIRDDGLLPKCGTLVTPAHLPRFAAWHQHIDIKLNRPAPVWTGPAIPIAKLRAARQLIAAIHVG